ncbi:MAG: metallopeptidase family protein [Clostridiales bacterium]
MISIEEMEIMLDEIANEFPMEFYKDLNGGIIILPEFKMHSKSVNNDLFILGEYHFNMSLGRYIIIYYGSFSRVHGFLSKGKFKEKLKSVLKHEFRHHIESLAGERGLEIEDEKSIAKYLKNKKL